MGALYSQYTQMFPPRPNWGVDDIPDLAGKVMIVTGGNSGIGKETVYLAARSQTRAKEAIEELKRDTGHEAIFLKLDLGDLHSVQEAAEQFASKEKQLHALFNNAGVMLPPVELVTVQGYDPQFGTNVLGHYYFAKLLLPILLDTARTTAEGKARVATTTSAAHYYPSSPFLDFASFKDGPIRQKMGRERLYAKSKAGNIVFANELHRRYGAEGIVSTSVNPGTLRTGPCEFCRSYEIPLVDLNGFINMFLYPASYGALTQLWAGTSQERLELGGKYLIPWVRTGEPYEPTNDPALGREL
ncbi:NAD(P)-binding protein [Punctularia strigosozonata HHB-11173 SS5]|uniref:NAD(P)-binding protein n=1 Tax=Punctularia strigosozonata (strain HHB-11173) TaxID=741275 RepID=UPI0004417B85|nr:NAD(P)-binding protein [Punctularia strigosozonata HHB-11173 SS5]EIN12422.1 NAD(P)-binding protein [Punctularia strigosozonata HHB-11173 SS5]